MPSHAVSRRVHDSVEEERRSLSRAEQLLKSRGGNLPKVTMEVEGQQVELPGSAVQHLRRLVSRLARGQEVAVFTPQESLTTQEAAELLHVSRPYLIGLLDKGLIPYYRLRSHRRIRLEDLLAFRKRFDAERHAALDELRRLSQEAGLYNE